MVVATFPFRIAVGDLDTLHYTTKLSLGPCDPVQTLCAPLQQANTRS